MSLLSMLLKDIFLMNYETLINFFVIIQALNLIKNTLHACLIPFNNKNIFCLFLIHKEKTVKYFPYNVIDNGFCLFIRFFIYGFLYSKYS